MKWSIPFAVPFTFTAAVAGTQSSASVRIPYNVAVYGISIAASNNVTSPGVQYSYNLEFVNFDSGDSLMDEPIQTLNLQTDARTYFKLPSKWYLKKSDKIVCNLNMLAGSATTTVFITLLTTVVDSDPNPGRTPFIYNFPINLGFQDNVTTFSGLRTLAFNQHSSGTISKHMLNDFELWGLTLDTSNGDGGLVRYPDFGLQVSIQNRKKFFDRITLNSNVGGGTTFGQGNFITGFPNNNVQQYVLPQPELIRRGEIVRVDIAAAPTYLTPAQVHVLLNRLASVALIGSHIG